MVKTRSDVVQCCGNCREVCLEGKSIHTDDQHGKAVDHQINNQKYVDRPQNLMLYRVIVETDAFDTARMYDRTKLFFHGF